MRCLWCGEEIFFTRGRGWVHAGGGIYVVKCVVKCLGCGWTAAPYPSPDRCPRCGGRVVDDHCALPEMGGRQRLGRNTEG